MRVTALLPRTAYRAAYRAQQTAFLVQCLAAHQFLRTVAGFGMFPSRDAVEQARRRYDELIARDLANVERGDDPRALLFQFPVTEYAKKLPQLVRDFPRAIRRAKNRDFTDLPNDVALERYPAYFRRNFHWQTDGYFSRR